MEKLNKPFIADLMAEWKRSEHDRPTAPRRHLGEMRYNYHADRWGIFDLDRRCWVTDGLHCGECFNVLQRSGIKAVRIEMADDWYLIGGDQPYKGWEMDGLAVVLD